MRCDLRLRATRIALRTGAGEVFASPLDAEVGVADWLSRLVVPVASAPPDATVLLDVSGQRGTGTFVLPLDTRVHQ